MEDQLGLLLVYGFLGLVVLLAALAPDFMGALAAWCLAIIIWLAALALFIWSFSLPWYFMFLVWWLSFIVAVGGGGMLLEDASFTSTRKPDTDNPDRNS
jgi:hypothetical protein